ncbi:BREX-2 system adenine-specific DNA-methyltransferase PglX [Actinoplanes sp. NPDC051346]|uniref:BREX-2 system adenine-specific DNA-methyltransferase PglX n=1 Tax=Actinoplanes sp. NPDC051346 TaxID=3155048 RepID=UPI0034486DA4
MIDEATSKALQGQVRFLVDDLRGQLAQSPGLRSDLRREHDGAERAERTASGFEGWLDDQLDQAAVAWVLGCVFVRFCEDNELVDGLWIGGDDPAARADDAVQRRQAYIIANPRENDREWLREGFRYLARLRATGKIFDDHNPLWRFDISGPAAEGLSDFFRKGAGRGSLRSTDLDTRFLGDLYQDLSAYAKKTYALLQTPEFVEEFILDRTFEPAVQEFGLSETSVIDPTCGSGHFLLGAFHRLVRKWQGREPTGDIRVHTERAMGQVTGVDINPFAVAIARFRLLVAGMRVCELKKLERTPAWPIRVATGDSLLPWGAGKTVEQTDLLLWQTEKPFAYASEDDDLLTEYLRPGQYAVVVGNPPYITVSDAARNKKYRDLYPTVCHRQYALTVPFAKRFFDLAKRSDEYGEGAGHVGQITGNAFMKREFGKKLIEDYFAHQVELTEVIDTSGAFIPGHGTPTVILIGRANFRRRGRSIRSALGIQGEPEAPEDAAEGLVWKAIINQIDTVPSESKWISVQNFERSRLDHFPWSLAGGGAGDLQKRIEAQTSKLAGVIDIIGRTTHTGLDEVFYASKPAFYTRGLLESAVPVIPGEDVRDFRLETRTWTLFPYDEGGRPRSPQDEEQRHYWNFRTHLQRRMDFGQTPVERGLRWFDHSMFFANRYRTPNSIAFPFVATHNHFVLDRGGKVFNRTAPVIKLPEGATEEEYLRLLGVLNSSTACFWLKQVSQNKGNGGIGGGIGDESWEPRYEFTGTKLQELPLPAEFPAERSRLIDKMAQRLMDVVPTSIARLGVPTRERLAAARAEYELIRARMIAVQEELDFEVYRLYGLIDEDLTHPDPPGIELGERAFEILMARQNVQTEWFNRHGSRPRETVNPDWPAGYRELVERRIQVITENRHIGLIERPECKRRWTTEGWDGMRATALRGWLLDRLEAPELWAGQPMPLSVAQLADRVNGDADFRHVLELWVGHDNYDLAKALWQLLADEHVPYLPAQRYKPSGLRKRAVWERTWALQRREDNGETVEIDVPLKYTSADFVRASFWRARGKLDVPKERFISYPKASRATDGSELLGWAGWDHLQQAQALATVYLDRKTQESWPAHLLLPLLAGLVELEPWLHQWYAEERPDFPGSPAQFFTDFINAELDALSSDRSALALLRGVPEQR